MTLIEAFKEIGFTKQEAELYLILSQNKELTGYEAAKLTNISRSNAYASLSSLVEKGGAYVLEGQPTKYIATPKNEFLLNVKRKFDKIIKYIDENVIYDNSHQDAYVTITGSTNIFNKINNMLELTTHHLYFSAHNSLIEQYKYTIEMIAQTKNVVILSNKFIDIPNITFYKQNESTSIKLITDTSTVITGNLEQCLYSKNKTLVGLIREALTNEIKIIKLNEKDI